MLFFKYIILDPENPEHNFKVHTFERSNEKNITFTMHSRLMPEYGDGTSMLRAETIYQGKRLDNFYYFQETSRLTDVGYVQKYNVILDTQTNDKIIYTRSSISGFLENERESLLVLRAFP